LLDMLFPQTADGTLTEGAYVLAPNGLRWLTRQRERHSSPVAVDEETS
jgi:hypothetical protein